MRSNNYYTDGVTSSIQVEVVIPNEAYTSFFGRISSESGWDFGHFYIDGWEQGSWSGESDWFEVSYPVSAGTHTFAWSYTKDGSVSSGDDCFYVDNIRFATMEPSRSFQHYHVYRTDEYNNGPFLEDNTVVLSDATNDTLLIDNTWPAAEMGGYKFGVSRVYEGNRESDLASGDLTQLQPKLNCTSRLRQKPTGKPCGDTRDEIIFSDDFENGMGNWTTIDADGDGRNWFHSTNHPVYSQNGKGHNGTDGFAISASYEDNGGGAFSANNYLVSSQMYYISEGMTFNFWADYGSDSYPDYFEVCVATVDTPTASDFMPVWGGNAKANGNSNEKTSVRHANNRYGNWRFHTVDLSAYAGQNVWIAFHHQDYDMYEIWIDDVELMTVSLPVQGPRESQIVWSNPLAKDLLINGVSVNVTLNSGDSAEGTVVSFVNQDWNEQEAHPVADIVLDESGYYAWDWFRKGDYYVTVSKEGYETISEYVSIYEPTNLQYQLEEIMTGISSLYVSRTGWAMWNGPAGNGFNLPSSNTSFFVDFDRNMPDGWTILDANNDGYTWCQTANITSTWTYYAGMALDWYHSGLNAICSGSYINGIGALTPDEYFISPQVYLRNGSQLSFWVSAADVGYPADHFGVFVSNTGTEPSDFTCVQEWTLTAKKEIMADGGRESRDGKGLRIGTWYQYTLDLSAYVGNAYIAFRHFNCYDQYIMILDDIELSVGSKGDRHLEAVQVILSDMSGNVLYSGETENDYMQLPVENLVEGQTYHLSVGSVYSSGLENWDEVDWVYEPCDNYEGVTNLIGQTLDDGVLISWDFDYDNFITDDTITYRSDNTLSINAELLCLNGQIVAHEANTNAGQGELGPNYSCLLTTPNPAWYYLRIDNPGDMDIYMYSTPTVDIDFCCWGPFRDPISPCPYGLTDDKVVSCSYSANASEYCYIPSNAQTGEYYILVLTNYSNQPCNFYFEQRGGSGSTNCSGYSGDGGFMIFRDGEWVGFTSDNSWLDAGATNTHEYEIRVAYPGTAICPDENFYFSLSCPQTVEVMGPVVTQTTHFAEGWNWWSTYVNQERIDGLSLLEEGLDGNGLMIKSQNNGFVTYQEGTGWYGSLNGINNESTYQVKTSSACTVSMTTEVVVAEEHPVTLNPGWTWAGYPSAMALSLTDAMANHDPAEGDMMKSQEGYAMFYPELGWIGSLRTLIPGMGLMYHSNGTAPVNLTYATGERAGETEENITARGNRWEPNPNAYRDNMTVLAVVELDGMELGSDRYELAAFANDVCLGSAKLMKVEALNRYMAFLTVYGEGTAELNFGLYDNETGMVTFESDERLDFVVNAITGDPMEPYVVSFRSTTGLDEHDANVNIYPNPVEKGSTFSLDLPADGSKVQVDVINALGVVVESVSTPAVRTMKAPEAAGVYTLRITVNGNRTYIRKLIVR